MSSWQAPLHEGPRRRAIVFIDETPGRIGFQLASTTIDDAQRESLPVGEFADVTQTFFVDPAQVTTSQL